MNNIIVTVSIFLANVLKSSADGYTKAISYQLDLPEHEFSIHKIREDAFEAFNVGAEDNELVRRWRQAGHRSMSVGDIIVINDVAYRCNPMGWTEVDFPGDLPIVPTLEITSNTSRRFVEGDFMGNTSQIPFIKFIQGDGSVLPKRGLRASKEAADRIHNAAVDAFVAAFEEEIAKLYPETEISRVKLLQYIEDIGDDGFPSEATTKKLINAWEAARQPF